MKTNKSIITSYSAPSREHLWFNPSDNTLRYFNGQEWAAVSSENTGERLGRLAETTTDLNTEIQNMNATIQELLNKLSAAEQNIENLKAAIVELSATQNTQQIDEAA